VSQVRKGVCESGEKGLFVQLNGERMAEHRLVARKALQVCTLITLLLSVSRGRLLSCSIFREN
jgi:hypothetical protein